VVDEKQETNCDANGVCREIFDMQMKSAACAHCTTPLSSDARLINPCPASSSSNFCPARFCNRLCLARSAKTHPLLCPARNPASVPLMKWARETHWMALNALAQCTSRILLANQVGEESLKGDWLIVKGLAVLGMEERFLYSFSSYVHSFSIVSAAEKLILNEKIH
jgi:hypothetical protein